SEQRYELAPLHHSIASSARPMPGARERRSLFLLARHGNRDRLTASDLVGRIKSVPARAGNVDFRPSMRGAVLTFAHLDVAGDESRPEPPMPRALHHEHREVAARSSTEHQRLVRQLDSGFLAPGIFERLMDVSIELVQKIEGANDLSGAVEVMQPILQLRTIVRIAGKAVHDQLRPARFRIR